jgi:hypothetical protein
MTKKTVALIPLEYAKNYQILKRVPLKEFYVAQSRFSPEEISTSSLPSSTILDNDDVRCIANNNDICYVPADEFSEILEFGNEKSILIYLRNNSEGVSATQ